jgi:pimeloyl-ACP methyl ester carboxylesterase
VSRLRLAVLFFAGLLLLAACGPDPWGKYHYTNPSDFYYAFPPTEGLRGPPPLLVVYLGGGRSERDCIDLFYEFVTEKGIALLCPWVEGRDGLDDRLNVETELAAILGQIYTSNVFEDKFYLAGFGDAGGFVLEYGLKYPSAVRAVSVMSVETYPEMAIPFGAPPVQLLAGESDEEGLAKARAQEEIWRSTGMAVRVVPVDGNGRAPSVGFARLTTDLIDQISR